MFSTQVGYTTIPMTGGNMDIIGAQFINTGSTTLDIQSIVLNNGKAADWLKVYNAVTGYLPSYNWSLSTYTNEGVEDFSYLPDLGPGWADGEGRRYCAENGNAVTIDPGQSFWLFMANGTGDKSVTIAGQVKASGFETVDMTAGKMDLVCSPYPCATDIQNIQLVNAKAADWLKVYTAGTGYLPSYNWSLSTYTNEGVEDFSYLPDLGPGWADGEGRRYCAENGNAISIGVGQGVWLFMAGNGQGTPQVKFVNPSAAK